MEIYKRSMKAAKAKKSLDALLSYSDIQRSSKTSPITTILARTKPTIAKVKRQMIFAKAYDLNKPQVTQPDY
jgi:hypothetical protein